VTTRDALQVRTIVELRASRQPVYSTEPYAALSERVRLARDAATPELPATLVQTTIRIRESDEAEPVAMPCSFDPSLVALIYAVEDE
jgi:hypothetical protein